MTSTRERQISDAARRAGDSRIVDWLARLGIATRAVLYVLVGVLAVEVAFGRRSTRADQSGALQAVARQPFGRLLLWVMAAGLVGIVLWQLTAAVWGHRAAEGRARTGKRIQSALRTVIYGALASSTATIALGGHANAGQQQTALTARLLRTPVGQPLVVAVGVVLIGWGGYYAFQGVRVHFDEKLRMDEMSRWQRITVQTLGRIGQVGRGLVAMLIGGFLIDTAIRFDPQHGVGLDSSLKQLAANPYGRWVLLAAAAGLVSFGLYGLAEIRWKRTDLGAGDA